jgi:penicillin-binding protein 1C
VKRGAWLAAAAAVIGALAVADRAFPPPDPAARAFSTSVLDRNGKLLRAFTVDDGRWRIKIEPGTVDPLLRRMAVAYEDKRFEDHFGVDPLAMLRAAKQLASQGRVVSGGSTITMQLARLLEPRAGRSVAAKLKQMARAMQLERRLGKDAILDWYFTFAPYGGNLEGVRAASLAWFGKEPRKLTVAEAALLIALPQSPETRRPDRHRAELLAARNRVIARAQEAGVIDGKDAEIALAQPLPLARRDMPALAAHAAWEAAKSGNVRMLTIDRDMQERAETIARRAARKLGQGISVAIIVADHRTGEILVRAGSAAPFDAARRGWIDMTRAVRSPGSALKPFIYGLAFDLGIAHPETLIDDVPENFRGYRPRDFTETFRGTVSLRASLQLSLNLPAVKLLDAVGPLRLASAFRNAGVKLKLPRDTSPTLAVALGGAGVTLADLVSLYSAIPRDGVPVALREMPLTGGEAREAVPQPALFGETASWYVADILAGTAPPDGAAPQAISYKTGTSYGYRDAWAIGFDRRLVAGVWVGRADGAATPEITGRTAAAPILFELFEPAGRALTPRARKKPPGAIAGALPVTLKYFAEPAAAMAPRAPVIMFPPEGARLQQSRYADGRYRPLVIKFEGGVAPYSVLLNGMPSATRIRNRQAEVVPEGRGFAALAVIDAMGRSASVDVFVE